MAKRSWRWRVRKTTLGAAALVLVAAALAPGYPARRSAEAGERGVGPPAAVPWCRDARQCTLLYVDPFYFGLEAPVEYVARGGRHPEGAVAIVTDDFACVPHGEGFATRERFLAHLRRAHGLDGERLGREVLRRGSRLVFLGSDRGHGVRLPVIRARQSERPGRDAGGGTSP